MEAHPEKRHGVKDVVASNVGVLSVVAMFYAICCAGAFGIEEMIPECGPGLTIVMLLVLPVCWALPYSLVCNTVYVVLAVGYLDEYESGIFSDFAGMLNVITITGIICVIAGLILWLIGRKVD